MNKILLIIKREYLTRVKKRTFIIMTILGPILMAAIFIVPVFLAQMSDEEKTIKIIDESGFFQYSFTDKDNMTFEVIDMDLETAKKTIGENEVILYIPGTHMNIPNVAELYSQREPGIQVKSHVENLMRKEIESLKLEANGVDKNILDSIRSEVNLTSYKLDESGQEKESFTEISMALGFIGGLLIYFFIFLYGSQVMRGVIEEKTNRIVEIIVSSVKPFQLMMGKIIGIALVGLTQFLLWVVLTFSIIMAFQFAFPDKFQMQSQEQTYLGENKIMNQEQISKHNQNVQADSKTINKIFNAVGTYDFREILLSFLFFFIFGYLMYSGLFAAIGSAVDNETDTQQFMLPVSMPLILAIVMAQFIIMNPDGPVSFWFSMIPLTSPVVMMIRIPFGIPAWQVYLSGALLVGAFILTTWMAGKIYRTGILMYGKKVTYRELWKWLKY